MPICPVEKVCILHGTGENLIRDLVKSPVYETPSNMIVLVIALFVSSPVALFLGICPLCRVPHIVATMTRLPCNNSVLCCQPFESLSAQNRRTPVIDGVPAASPHPPPPPPQAPTFPNACPLATFIHTPRTKSRPTNHPPFSRPQDVLR